MPFHIAYVPQDVSPIQVLRQIDLYKFCFWLLAMPGQGGTILPVASDRYLFAFLGDFNALITFVYKVSVGKILTTHGHFRLELFRSRFIFAPCVFC